AGGYAQTGRLRYDVRRRNSICCGNPPAHGGGYTEIRRLTPAATGLGYEVRHMRPSFLSAGFSAGLLCGFSRAGAKWLICEPRFTPWRSAERSSRFWSSLSWIWFSVSLAIWLCCVYAPESNSDRVSLLLRELREVT